MVGRETLANSSPPARRVLPSRNPRVRSAVVLLGVPTLVATAGWALYAEPWRAPSGRPAAASASAGVPDSARSVGAGGSAGALSTGSSAPSPAASSLAGQSPAGQSLAGQSAAGQSSPMVLPTGAPTAADASANPLPALPKACHSAPAWALRAPDSATSPADGIVARTWNGTSWFGASLRLVAVQADLSRIKFSVSTASRLGGVESTSDQTDRAGAAVGLNGDFFTWGPTGEIPFGVQVTGSQVRYAPPGVTRAVGYGDDGRFHYAYVHVVGDAAITRPDGAVTRVPIGAVNAAAAKVVTLVTSYAARQPIRGAWFVAIHDGVVRSSSSRDPGGPASGDQLLVAPAGRAALLSSVTVGSPATVQAAVRSDYGITFSEALGSGSEMLRDSRYTADCVTKYGITTRPRTIIAWNADDGRFWLFAAQSTGVGAFHPGNRGLSYSETADLLRRLGATDAVPLDGGGSTTLIFKKGSRTTRVDAAADYPQRPIPDVMLLSPK